MKRFKYKIIGLIIAALLFAHWYHPYKVIARKDLNQAFIMNSAGSFKGYFYEGTDDQYHYFISKWDFARDDYFKIPLSDMKVMHQHALRDNKEVRIDVFKTDSIFAKINNHELYYTR